MELSEKFVRKQIERVKPFANSASLDTLRKSQDLLGSILAKTMRKNVSIEERELLFAKAALITPNDVLKEGIILYLHGGGYTCGDLQFAKGFGSILAVECGIRVFCLAYRLAPEDPFPAALDDALEAYRGLLTAGYLPGQIVLCGESAGGGLCYCLCLRLKEMRLPLPSCIVAISPWTDLTQSGKSYEYNKDIDPMLSKHTLDFNAECYSRDVLSPLVSPLYGELEGMPPSLIFAGSDEVLLEDSKRLDQKLRESGCLSELIIAERMWHAYVLYCIRERAGDLRTIDRFLNRFLSHERKLRWMKLDNAAKIYPAAKRRKWNNFFRLSATLSEDVNCDVLRSALDVTVRRFPSIAVRLCKGMFWYYLEELSVAPELTQEQSCPLAHATFDSINECAFRVIVYKKRIAVEFYHALTDGNGGLVFLKSLLAEYLEQRYGISIPNELGVLDRLEEPSEEELEDSFVKYKGKFCEKRHTSSVYKIKYTPEKDGFRHLTTFIINSDAALSAAKEYGVTLTTFMCAAMLLALQRLQNVQYPNRHRQRPIRVVIPVNLRNLFPSKTLRNFVHVVMPGIDPRMGDFEFDEICKTVHHQIGVEVTEKAMSAKFTPNVKAETSPILRIMPLFTKNIVMKAIYDSTGERPGCLNISNLGVVRIPEQMQPYVTRFDFILGVQASKPNNCGMLSYNGTLYMNFIRNTVEPCLELEFFRVLHEFGLAVKVESNQRSK